MGHYRIRFMPYSHRYCVERRIGRKVLGFWPVYDWVLEGFFDTAKMAQDFLLMISKEDDR